MEINIESFINVCDDMFIDGEYEMDIAEEGVSIDAFKVYISKDFKKMKAHYRSAKSFAKQNKKDEALEEIDECIEAVNELKKEVAKIPDGSKVGSFFSFFNPLLLFIRNTELDSVSPGIGYQFGRGGGPTTTLTFNYIRYADVLSKGTSNEVKTQIQEALNLFVKHCNDIEKRIENKEAYKKATENFSDLLGENDEIVEEGLIKNIKANKSVREELNSNAFHKAITKLLKEWALEDASNLLKKYESSLNNFKQGNEDTDKKKFIENELLSIGDYKDDIGILQEKQRKTLTEVKALANTMGTDSTWVVGKMGNSIFNKLETGIFKLNRMGLTDDSIKIINTNIIPNVKYTKEKAQKYLIINYKDMISDFEDDMVSTNKQIAAAIALYN